MIQPLLTSLRTLIVQRLVKAMPLRQVREFPLEPDTSEPEPDIDVWLLDEPADMRSEFDQYTSSFKGLSEQLSSLRALTSKVAAHAPLEAEPAPATTTAPVWADADLFDGEALPAAARDPQWAAPVDHHLFDEDASDPIPPVHVDQRVGLHLPLPEQQYRA